MAEPIIAATRWRTRAVSFYGVSVPLEFKLLNKREAPGFMKQLAGVFSGSIDEGKPIEEQAEEAEQLFEKKWDGTFVREELFGKRIRLPQPVELDGQKLSTPLELLDESEPMFLMEVIVAFQIANSLSRDQGNASGSPSEPVPAAVPGGSSTDATSTASEDSPAS
jgi:hypothetical protein